MDKEIFDVMRIGPHTFYANEKWFGISRTFDALKAQEKTMRAAIKSVPVPAPPRFVDLIDITEADAQILVNILKRIAGSPSGSRGAADRLLKTLESAGVNAKFGYNSDKLAGDIRFND